MRVVPKPQGARIPDQFVIKKMEIYDDVLLKWVDLTSGQQLHEYDQLYCFQPHSPWQTDAQQDLPAPRPPTRPIPFGASLGPSTPQPIGGTPMMTQPDPVLSGGMFYLFTLLTFCQIYQRQVNINQVMFNHNK